VDVVYAEDFVVDDALDEVEDAPSDEHPADERLSRVARAISRGPPEHPQAEDDENPGGGVKEAIGSHVGLHAVQRGRRPAIRTGQHVVPLHDLVKDDAVQKTAQPHAERDPGRRQRGVVPPRFAVGHAACLTRLHDLETKPPVGPARVGGMM